MDPLSRLGVIEAASLIRRGELSSVEYSTALLDRIESTADLNAFITVCPDALLDQARAADETLARGERAGALHGVPVAIKDNIDTAELPTTGGTPALRAHRPARDAEVVARMRRAGGLVLGKTNLHELAYGLTGENASYGAVCNPYARDRFAGGSSAGTAAAVAAGLAPAGLGTDTGGSVRVPASLCGVTGLRPTTGRYPQHGLLLVSGTRDTVGLIAGSVADLAALDSVLVGGSLAPTATTPRKLAGVRLGVVTEPFFTGMAPELTQVVANRLAELDGQGAELVELRFPPETGEVIVKAGFPIAFYETPVELARYLDEHDVGVTLAELVGQCASVDVKWLLSGLIGAAAVPVADYHAAMTVHRPVLRRMLTDLFDAHRLDGFVWPTTPLTAAPLGTSKVPLDGGLTATFLAYTRTTNLGSVVGWPGVTIPAGIDENGLPIGLALDGPPGSDRGLLELAEACEAVFGQLDPPKGW